MTNTKTEIRKTITSIFMVPTIKIPKDALKENGFLNGYSNDKIHNIEYEDAIFLLFRPNQIDRFREFLDSEYERTKSVVEDYDHPGGFVVVVYKLDNRYKSDFFLIRQGMYSKTSKEFQDLFSRTITIVERGKSHEEISLQFRVFHRTEDLTKFWEDKFNVDFDEEQELWEGFSEKNEILTEEKLKEYDKQ
jgi:hypothetical protein